MGLTNLQLHLVNTFRYDLPEEQLIEIKKLLANYFAEKVTLGVDAVFEKNGWGEEKLEEWSKAHFRTPYKQ